VAPTEGRVARPERQWGSHHSTPIGYKVKQKKGKGQRIQQLISNVTGVKGFYIALAQSHRDRHQGGKLPRALHDAKGPHNPSE